MEEPLDVPPVAIAADWQVPMLQPIAHAVPTADNQFRLATPRPSVTGEPQKSATSGYNCYPTERIRHRGLHEVPKVDVSPRTACMQLPPRDDGATLLRDRRLAEYEARVQRSKARPMVHPENGP